MTAERPGFTTNDIPYPSNLQKGLARLDTYRSPERSLGASVAHVVIDESHELFRDIMKLVPATTTAQWFHGATFAAAVATCYATPAYYLLCAEEMLRTGEPNPDVILPDEWFATSAATFFTEWSIATGLPLEENVAMIERSLTVTRADRFVIERGIAEYLPGQEPVEFVDFASMEERDRLNRSQIPTYLDTALRIALLEGTNRFEDLYDAA